MGALREMFPCDNPYSPHLTSLDSRLQMFNDNSLRWSQVRIRATSLQMAQAGLYYLGERDRVKCYYCNGGLQNWDVGDNPWFEHAKWFPLCEYVLRNKGPEYVERVNHRFSNLQRPRGAGSRQPLDIDPYRDGAVRSRRPQEYFENKPPPIVDPGEERRKKQEQIEKELGNSDVIQAFELGFERHQIRRALSIRLDEYGRGFGKVETLVTYLLDEQNQGELNEGCRKTAEPLKGECDETELKQLVNQDICRVCHSEKARTVLMPCGHLVVCKQCGSSISHCPVCRVKVASRIDVFRV